VHKYYLFFSPWRKYYLFFSNSTARQIVHGSCHEPSSAKVGLFLALLFQRLLADDGWSVTEGDGVDDVCVSVNSSPSKAINCNAAFNSGLPIVSNSALCAKASMLLQGPPCNHDTFFF
jgi:hypothetical protein